MILYTFDLLPLIYDIFTTKTSHFNSIGLKVAFILAFPVFWLVPQLLQKFFNRQKKKTFFGVPVLFSRLPYPLF